MTDEVVEIADEVVEEQPVVEAPSEESITVEESAIHNL